MTKLETGNNESLVKGLFDNGDGTWTAITFTKSKTFKTEAGAIKWLVNNGG